jgi:hypothetical protein
MNEKIRYKIDFVSESRYLDYLNLFYNSIKP